MYLDASNLFVQIYHRLPDYCAKLTAEARPTGGQYTDGPAETDWSGFLDKCDVIRLARKVLLRVAY